MLAPRPTASARETVYCSCARLSSRGQGAAHVTGERRRYHVFRQQPLPGKRMDEHRHTTPLRMLLADYIFARIPCVSCVERDHRHVLQAHGELVTDAHHDVP